MFRHDERDELTSHQIMDSAEICAAARWEQHIACTERACKLLIIRATMFEDGLPFHPVVNLQIMVHALQNGPQ